MRTRYKAALGVLVAVVAVFAVLAATGAYFVMRNLETTVTGEAEANTEMDAVRQRYAPRAPLIEIVDARTGDIRISREPAPAATSVSTVHVVNWKSENNELMRTEMPLWLMRFSSVNVLSKLGVAPARFRLTVEDIQRYGPGIVADYRSPGAFSVLIWVD